MKCEKLVSKSYQNSKSYVEKLENEIENKDKIIKRLLASLENFSNTATKYTNSDIEPSLPITNSQKKDNIMQDDVIKSKQPSFLAKTNQIFNENLENQLNTVRNLQKEKYYSQHFSKVKDTSTSNPILNVDSSNKVLHDDMESKTHVDTKNSEKSAKTKTIKKKTVMIIGDSMVNGIEESKLSKSRHIRVQPLSGAKIEDLQANLDELLHNDLEKVVLHAGTNNSTNDTPEDILDKLKTLVDTIQTALPECKVIVSSIIKRTDNQKANAVCEKVNRLLKSSDLCVLDNSNIKEKCLGKRGLHLNMQGNAVFASNLLNAIKA